jgi:hypothetical protein
MSAEENIASEASLLLLGSLMGMTEAPRPGLYETPIERWFYLGFAAAWHLTLGWRTPLVAKDCPVGIGSQVRALDWPVDYVITVETPDKKVHKLAVECDGHDFHERTKEQARRDRERDRALQDAGFVVYRFTGSELYRNAWECGMQAVRWACKVLEEPIP